MSGDYTDAMREVMREFDEAFMALHEQLGARLLALPPEQQDEIDAAIRAMSQTNCAWSEYAVGKMLDFWRHRALGLREALAERLGGGMTTERLAVRNHVFARIARTRTLDYCLACRPEQTTEAGMLHVLTQKVGRGFKCACGRSLVFKPNHGMLTSDRLAALEAANAR